MKRLLPLAFLSFLLLPSAAAGDGCPPEQCGVQSAALPGSPVVALRPFGGFEVYDVRTGERRFAAPYGVLSADGRAYWVTRNTSAMTELRRRNGHTGRLEQRYELRSRLGAAAVSADGRFVALVDGRSTRVRTVVVVLDTRTGRNREFALDGNFRPEALSRDGRRLFLVEYLRGGYRVRLYELGLGLGRLRPGELRPRNEDEAMRGFPAFAVGSPDGRWLLTLYVKPKEREAFVHALDLRRAAAYCIDLPGRGRAQDLGKYALALGLDGRTLFASNPALGLTTKVDLRTLETSPAVKFARSDGGGNWTNAAVSPRGDLVYIGGLRKLWAYDVRVRRMRGPYDVGRISGFAFTPDGRRLMVLRPSGKKAIWLDAATGRRV